MGQAASTCCVLREKEELVEPNVEGISMAEWALHQPFLRPEKKVAEISETSPKSILSEPEAEEASLVEVVAKVPPLCRRRAATEWIAAADLSEPDPEESPRPLRARAATACTALEMDISGGDAPGQADSPGSEWEEDWSAIEGHLQPQHFQIGETRGAVAGRRRQIRLRKLVVRIAAPAEKDLEAATEKQGERRTGRARTMSDVGLASRKGVTGRRSSADGVYGLDWADL